MGKAKPLFRGHYRPLVPADLGYYDLRVPDTREAQAAMAKELRLIFVIGLMNAKTIILTKIE